MTMESIGEAVKGAAAIAGAMGTIWDIINSTPGSMDAAIHQNKLTASSVGPLVTNGELAKRHLAALNGAGAQWLTCVYGGNGSMATGGMVVHFWFNKVMVSQKELSKMYQYHPLRLLGDSAFATCPSTFNDAEAYRNRSSASWEASSKQNWSR